MSTKRSSGTHTITATTNIMDDNISSKNNTQATQATPQLPPDEKVLRRREKNRLSAQECRKRKRARTQSMEQQIQVLEQENLQLRLQLKIGQEAEEKVRQEQELELQAIASLLEKGSSEATVNDTIEVFQEKFVDFGKNRRSAMEFHLRNIERLLTPTPIASVAIHALHGGTSSENDGQVVVQVEGGVEQESFSDGSPNGDTNDNPLPLPSPGQTSDPKALFDYLVQHLEMTPQQAMALNTSHPNAQELTHHLSHTLSVLDQLKTHLTQCTDDLEAERNTVRSILSPRQAAKFFVWVTNNGACMHFLNELWSQAYASNTGNSGNSSAANSTKSSSNPSTDNEEAPPPQQQEAASTRNQQFASSPTPTSIKEVGTSF